MSSFLLSLNAVFPLFILMLIGYLAKKIKLIGETTISQMNKMVFKLFLPLLIFLNVYSTTKETAFAPKLTIYIVGAIVLSFIVSAIIIPLFVKENKQRGALIQGIMRSNFVILGIPTAVALLDEDQVGMISLMIGIVIPVFNILAVICLEMYRGEKGEKINMGSLLMSIIKNPLIIASFLGMIFLLLDINLHKLIMDPISSISKIATPLSLILLGATFEFKEMKGNTWLVFFGVLGKLVIIPGIFIPLAILLGFGKAEIVCLIGVFCSPAAVSSFTMAKEMDSDSVLASQLVVVGSTASVVTIFLWIFVLNYLGAI